MAQRLIARLRDGAEYVVRVRHGTPAEALESLTRAGEHRPWLDVEGGRVRYDAVAAFLLADDRAERELGELLLELHRRGGATLEEVRRELARRGIGTG
ncbi:MAG TPA: hypothetical protein VNJ46_06000 [Gaiellaceae bacterium]|nr:hypothetical protein [Gaiellaceae bacterium]